jgi:hypothetical protein
MSGMGKMSMTFSQNGRMVGMYGTGVKNTRNVVVVAVPQPQPQPQVKVQQRVMPSRSAPKNIKQLFNLAHIMANPGTPCKACGS